MKTSLKSLHRHCLSLKTLAFCFLALLGTEACSQGISYKTITVEPYMAHQNYEHFTRLTLKSSDPEAEFISGFDFEWGYAYKLRLEVQDLGSRLSDGTGFEYSLEKVISKEPVPEDFEFRLFINPRIYYYDLPQDELRSFGENSELEEVDSTGAVRIFEQPKHLKILTDSTYLYMEEVEIEVPAEFRDAFARLRNGVDGKVAYFSVVNGKRIRLERF